MSKEKVLKTKSEIQKSDVIELFDRSRMAMFDLSQIASDKDFELSISIKSSGSIWFEVIESCEDVERHKLVF